ncbi:MAG: Ig-like domain-containing protein [Planctomycetaceae bacterium]|jgi:hypothetical protein|nr:Ig-like domain-containing protein [Planctomycetaceae bacterium]
MRHSILLLCFGLVLYSFIVSGCSRSGVPVQKVLGTVTLDGKPIDDVTVSFVPKSGGSRPAIGRTNPQGQFEMITGGASVNGVMTGEYIVTFTKSILVTPDGKEAKPFEFLPNGDPPPAQKLTEKHLIPLKYSDVKEPLFDVTVESGKTNRYTFDLKSE